MSRLPTPEIWPSVALNGCQKRCPGRPSTIRLYGRPCGNARCPRPQVQCLVGRVGPAIARWDPSAERLVRISRKPLYPMPTRVIRKLSEESEGPDGDRRRDPNIAASSRCTSVWPCRPAASGGPSGPAATPIGADRQSGSTTASLEAPGSAVPRLDPPDAAGCAA